MGTSVDANGRSILHKGHGMTHTCPVPDVCKTPSPGGPVPIPYVNIAMDSNITDGAETVKIEGNPVANVGAKISTSTGDEAGSAGGGILSSKIKGTVTWKIGSLDVKAEGKSVVRFLDQNFHNGNSFNTSFKDLGGTGMAYGDDFEGKCPVCKKKPDDHAILETANTAKICAAIIEKLKAEFLSLRESKGEGGQVLVARKQFMKIGSRSKFVGWRGYMVGVMICKHPEGSTPRIFAAISGYRIPPRGFKFETIAKGEGVHQVFLPDGAAVSNDELITANRSGASAAKVGAAVRKASRAIAKNRGKPGYTPAGTCAAQRLLARSGHAPRHMTEMFFVPPGGIQYAGKYDFRRGTDVLTGTHGAVFGPHVKEAPDTPWGPSVGSCHNCQKLLPLTLCPPRQCS